MYGQGGLEGGLVGETLPIPRRPASENDLPLRIRRSLPSFLLTGQSL